MAISHADHDHANTPAARAACRKAMAGTVKAPQMTVVPRKRGDGGVVRGMQATKPHAGAGNLKRPGTHLRNIGDLPDVPRMLAYCAKLAWHEGWDVVVGHPFNDSEANIKIMGPKAEITCIWRHTLKDGIWALHLRRPGSPTGCGAASSALEAIEMAAGRLPLPK